ncbi:hypothetical protein DsansV1_C38g0236031 [Dioscorea sansibarensis]
MLQNQKRLFVEGFKLFLQGVLGMRFRCVTRWVHSAPANGRVQHVLVLLKTNMP